MENKTQENEIDLSTLEKMMASLLNIMPSDSVIVVETPNRRYTLDKEKIRIVREAGRSEVIFHTFNI